MTEQKSGARGRDDGDLQDAQATPSQSGSSGGATARDVGTRDEEKNATGGDPAPTRATKQDKVQPATKSRSDNEGA
jgi:hypothetical protein